MGSMHKMDFETYLKLYLAGPSTGSEPFLRVLMWWPEALSKKRVLLIFTIVPFSRRNGSPWWTHFDTNSPDRLKK
jgi:hypothetical protein